ncbi:class I SAM-dependent methyltransferase [Neolewinella lacunae]|uniref:Class I SAM-dependent methyltransferase n=1 Tax=Neolewinella lacunae TaxID=1517758 RepID=A0A923PNW1_9BACT|nr:class I SAM-dependent methyltransferase [Neolewinella lacunae]MBC6994759.1 class I SAM-dependent methyltransferase [Neolewinella lacunae]MDN3634381.1 class I SAM-dependent methyltransferase [Neolewinella lacunae]
MDKDYSPFANRLRKMARHYDKWARRQELEAYRIYDADLDEFPITIDRYGEQLYVSVYHRQGEQWTEEDWQEHKLAYREVITQTLEMGRDAVFFKLRKRQSGTDQYEKLSIVRREFTVVENSLGFIVNLTDYLDTGLFLDHRQTRMMVAQEAKDKVVLNLFAYTCSFSVYAAAADAKRVDSVDLSNTYLDWGQRNFTINEIDPAAHRFIKADVITWLEEHHIANYDLIILDPPTFSNSKMMKEVLDTQRDHLRLINLSLRLLKPGGKLYFSTNYRKFRLDEAGVIGAAHIREITKQTLPPDFRKMGLHRCWIFEK